MARSAARGSCVTMTIVWAISTTVRRRNARTSAPLLESRFPVGSSAKMMSGRLAIARALASKPAVIFADEPTGNLDSKASDGILELLRRAVDEFGQTVVMVTHDASAASYADQLVVLVDGQVVEDREAPDADAILDVMKSVA